MSTPDYPEQVGLPFSRTVQLVDAMLYTKDDNPYSALRDIASDARASVAGKVPKWPKWELAINPRPGLMPGMFEVSIQPNYSLSLDGS